MMSKLNVFKLQKLERNIQLSNMDNLTTYDIYICHNYPYYASHAEQFAYFLFRRKRRFNKKNTQAFLRGRYIKKIPSFDKENQDNNTRER